MDAKIRTLINSKLYSLSKGELDADKIGAFLVCLLKNNQIIEKEYDAQFKKALRILLF